MQGIDLIFSIIVLVMSAVVHEVSHGYAALLLGDVTARVAGRLTLNPLKHLDPIGSVLVPILTSFTGMVFGWAKPVPYNPYNLKNPRVGEALVAAAGPASNIFIATIFGILLRFGGAELSPAFSSIVAVIVIVNLVLAVFNLVPVPPLDGSKILLSVLPFSVSRSVEQIFARYGMLLVILFILFFWQFVSPVVGILFRAITGF